MKYWEIIADNLSKAGWSWGSVLAIDSNGRTMWITDAHRVNKRLFTFGRKLLTYRVTADNDNVTRYG